MGERFQFYVRVENKEGGELKDKVIVALHDQWCYGGRSVKYGSILLNYLRGTDYANTYFYDASDFAEYIKAILTIRWHTPDSDDMKGIKYYPHRVSIEDMEYSPDRADTNHGCLIVFLEVEDRELKSLKASFFNEEGNFITAKDLNNKMEKTKTMEDKEVEAIKEFDKLTEDDYVFLCREMAELAKGGK